MNVVPFADRVAVKPIEEDEYEGMVVIPDAAKEKPQRGIVVKVGPGRWENGVRVEPDATVGDTVLFGKYSGVEVLVDGQELLIMREADILCAFDNGDQPDGGVK